MNAKDRPGGSKMLFTEALYKDLGNLYKNRSITSPIPHVILQNTNTFLKSLYIACFEQLTTITGARLITLSGNRVYVEILQKELVNRWMQESSKNGKETYDKGRNAVAVSRCRGVGR